MRISGISGGDASEHLLATLNDILPTQRPCPHQAQERRLCLRPLLRARHAAHLSEHYFRCATRRYDGPVGGGPSDGFRRQVGRQAWNGVDVASGRVRKIGAFGRRGHGTDHYQYSRTRAKMPARARRSPREKGTDGGRGEQESL